VIKSFNPAVSLDDFVNHVEQRDEGEKIKMVSRNMAKMSRSNVKAKKWMTDNGYKDIFMFPHTRFSKDLHFQGQDFDGIATHKDRVVLFQIKSNCRALKQTLRDYARLSAIFNIECLWFNAVDRGGLQINNQLVETFKTNED